MTTNSGTPERSNQDPKSTSTGMLFQVLLRVTCLVVPIVTVTAMLMRRPSKPADSAFVAGTQESEQADVKPAAKNAVTKYPCFGAKTKEDLEKATQALFAGQGAVVQRMLKAGTVIQVPFGAVVKADRGATSTSALVKRYEVEGVTTPLWMKREWIDDPDVPAEYPKRGSGSYASSTNAFQKEVEASSYDRRVKIWADQFDRPESWVRQHTSPSDSPESANVKMVMGRLQGQ